MFVTGVSLTHQNSSSRWIWGKFSLSFVIAPRLLLFVWTYQLMFDFLRQKIFSPSSMQGFEVWGLPKMLVLSDGNDPCCGGVKALHETIASEDELIKFWLRHEISHNAFHGFPMMDFFAEATNARWFVNNWITNYNWELRNWIAVFWTTDLPNLSSVHVP